LFQSHIDLAHTIWEKIVRPGDTVVDATSGNGHDTLALAKMALTKNEGRLFALDLQKDALASCETKLREHLADPILSRVKLLEQCHSQFPEEIKPGTVSLIVYNLGYLPGGDKSKTTKADTTLQSLQKALLLIQEGGCISITCYPGHSEGLLEEEKLLDFAMQLDPSRFSICHHRWVNRKKSPSLLLIQRSSANY
jgi:hypothetical protein